MQDKQATSNPLGASSLKPVSPVVEGPSVDVRAKQDPAHTEGEFMRDLAKATTNQSKERLARRSERD
jgi:hypothetical protein